METVEIDSPKLMTWKQVKYLGLLFDKTNLSDDEKDQFWTRVIESSFARDEASEVITALIGERNGYTEPEAR